MYGINKKYAKYLIEKNHYDIFHPTYYDAYFLPLLKKPFVLTVHDLTHEIFPEFFPQNDPFITYKRMVIAKADHIIAISASTSQDLQKIFGIAEKKISVIHHGYFKPHIQANEDFALPDRYLLYVGDRTGYKNFTRFITAVTPLLHQDQELSVICAGGGKFNLAERELFHRNRISGKILQRSATDPQLKTLYQKALIFVYPSLYEGFGLPILEAFSNNCAVAMSNSSCFPEVGDQAVIYFDPYSPEDMLKGIQSILYNNELANALTQKGKERLRHFSYEKCMEKTLNIYRNLGGN